MKKQVNIGTRRSRLARIQTESVLSQLMEYYPDVNFNLTEIITTGDSQKTTPIELIPGYGAFVKELQETLINGKIDIAVHSLKDLPVEEPSGLYIAAVTGRLDPRDVLVSRAGKINELPAGSLIGAGSPRRKAQLLDFRPDLRVQRIRGNIDTRIAKVDRGELDGIIVAAAGLIRLGWEDKITEYLPLERFLPEAGQAALAVEVRADDEDIIEMVKTLNDKSTAACVIAERSLVKTMGGGCGTALGVLGTVRDNTMTLRGMAPGAGKLIYAQEEGEESGPEKIAGRLAEKLWGMGVIPLDQVQR